MVCFLTICVVIYIATYLRTSVTNLRLNFSCFRPSTSSDRVHARAWAWLAAIPELRVQPPEIKPQRPLPTMMRMMTKSFTPTCRDGVSRSRSQIHSTSKKSKYEWRHTDDVGQSCQFSGLIQFIAANLSKWLSKTPQIHCNWPTNCKKLVNSVKL